MRRSKKPLVYDLSTVKSLPTFKTCSVSIAAPPIQLGCSWFRALVDFFFAFLGQNDIGNDTIYLHWHSPPRPRSHLHDWYSEAISDSMSRSHDGRMREYEQSLAVKVFSNHGLDAD